MPAFSAHAISLPLTYSGPLSTRIIGGLSEHLREKMIAVEHAEAKVSHLLNRDAGAE